MNIFKALFLIIIWCFWFFTANAWYNYPYVCEFDTCYKTDFKEITPEDDWYFLTDENISNINNFDNFIEWKLDEYINYYDDETFRVNWYYSWTGSIEDVRFTLEELLDLDTEFYWARYKNNWDVRIENTYINGHDFLFRHFRSIINSLHYWFPRWDKKNSLSDMLPNIVWYNNVNQSFYVKNICSDGTCHNSYYWYIWYNSNNNFILLDWTVKHNSDFILDTFKVSDDYSISNTYIKAWWSLRFDFWFEDYLDVWSSYTSYNYKISYNYEWEPIKELLSETINITNEFDVSSPTIDTAVLATMIEWRILNRNLKKIRLWINEGLNLTKEWKIYFYLSVENLNTWDRFDPTQINTSPVYVVPSDNVTTWDAVIFWLTEELNDTWFNIWDTFQVTMHLNDEFWNEHFDDIDWYEISLANGSSDHIELAYQWLNDYYDKLDFVKSSSSSPYPIFFKFRITQEWYHDLTGFDIKIRRKQTTTSYRTPASYTYYNWLVPSNIYKASGQRMRLFIKSQLISDFPVTCTSWNITFEAVCNSDNFSWCKPPSSDSTVSFTSPLDNWATGRLKISDYAWNEKFFNYTMNHIDRSEPVISLFKEWSELDLASYSFKANSDKFKIYLSESTTSNCDAEITYNVKLNWTDIYNDTLIWSNTEILIDDIFSTSWVKNIEITAIDKYNNSSSKNIWIEIFPDDVDLLNSNITFTWLDRIANNSDYYSYALKLEDKFGNPIYWKNINTINQDCNLITGCKTIMSDMRDPINPLWIDVIDEYEFNWISDPSWIINFKVKSFVPWDFTNRFTFDLDDWDNSNNILPTSSEYSLISSTQQENLFLSPISASINVSNDWIVWSWFVPELWKEQIYRVNLDNIWGITWYSNWRLLIDENSITPLSSWHFWRDFTLTRNRFNSNLNTALWFNWSIDASVNALAAIDVSSDDVVINYYMDSKNLYYPLDNFWVMWCDIWTIWVKLTWLVEWEWKSELTWQGENFSDLDKASLRWEIRKNAYILANSLKSLPSWTVINNVKYVNNDITLGWNLFNYETLIVDNANVYISSDLNTWNRKLWIIVLKDNYNLENDYNDSWNIYVWKDVWYIAASIYADWAFRSATVNWNDYSDIDLVNKLELYWSLFTRNTIWWAVKLDTDYLLPWWEKISDFNLASKYDLNYVRKTSICWIDDYSFLINYNPNIQLDPPKWFKK